MEFLSCVCRLPPGLRLVGLRADWAPLRWARDAGAAGGLRHYTESAVQQGLQHVCTEIALLHHMDTLMRHGKQLVRDSLKNNPAKFITLCNALSNMSNTGLAFDKLKLLSANQPPPPRRSL